MLLVHCLQCGPDSPPLSDSTEDGVKWGVLYEEPKNSTGFWTVDVMDSTVCFSVVTAVFYSMSIRYSASFRISNTHKALQSSAMVPTVSLDYLGCSLVCLKRTFIAIIGYLALGACATVMNFGV